MKKEDLIIDKWYKNNNHKNVQGFKIKNIVNNKVLISQYVRNNNHYSSHGAICEPISTFRLLTDEELIQYLPKDHPDLPNIKFPKSGFCITSIDNIKVIANHLRNNNVNLSLNDVFLSDATGICWAGTIYYYTRYSSIILKLYNIEDLINIINNKTKINHGNKQSNDVSTIASEDNGTSRSGTVILRCGRQQITTGIRPKGNKSIANIGNTQIRGVKISKSVIKRENY